MNKHDHRRIISAKIDKAIYRYKMIEPEEKIIVAVSGGKDSLCLAYYLNEKQKHFAIPFSIEAVHITMDFSPGESRNEDIVRSALERWDIPLKVIEVPVIARLKPGKKMNCYWCATQRRLELMRYAKEQGCEKIALGHHQDDILETLFMNMAYKGEMSTMLPYMKYNKFPHTVIRPMALVKEREVEEFMEQQGIIPADRSCIYDTRSKRKHVREAIEVLAQNNDSIKDNLYRSMASPISQYLPE